MLTVSFLEAQTEEVEVAAMYHSSLQVSSKPKSTCSSFQSLILSLLHHNWQSEKPVLLAVVHWPAAAYAQFLSEFSDSLSSLVVTTVGTDKVIIVGKSWGRPVGWGTIWSIKLSAQLCSGSFLHIQNIITHQTPNEAKRIMLGWLKITAIQEPSWIAVFSGHS